MVAISATFTAEPLREPLVFWLNRLGFQYRLRFAPYNQVFQQLLDPASLLARNSSGINVVLVRFEDWARFRGDRGSQGETIEETCRQLAGCLDDAARKFAAPFLVFVCPSSPAFLADAGNVALHGKLMREFEETLSGLPSLQVITGEETQRLYPVEDVHDPHGDQLGHVPYTPDYFTALGTMLARRIHTLRTAPPKVVVLDCDETLWSGICGEDGPAGVEVDPPRWELQEMMLERHADGLLLCLCSKNNEEDVLETFREHPEMPLKLEHFVARRVNWEPKSANLVSLADELNLGLDSFVFIDDNPKECAEVAADCPEVLALPLPAVAAEIPGFLKHVWALDRRRATAEDRQRQELYAQRAERLRHQRQASSLREFLASLELEIRIQPISAAALPRAAQLTQRTNQMNVSSIRRTEAEIQAWIGQAGREALTVDVADRFGGYGLTGLVLFETAAGRLVVDTFLLSCRVLGRGVEHRLVNRLGEIAIERGLDQVELPFVPSKRNKPALQFLESIGAGYRVRVDGEARYRFPAEVAAGVEYHPAEDPAPGRQAGSGHTAGNETRKAIPYLEIATRLSQVGVIREHIRAANRNGAATPPAVEESLTELEQRVAALWAELLGVERVGPRDNFFDLGGHSLMAVELLSRVRRLFGADLSLEVVYSGVFTVESLAQAIELKQIEQAGEQEYADLLKELEGLSDDEVRALLAEEKNNPPDRN